MRISKLAQKTKAISGTITAVAFLSTVTVIGGLTLSKNHEALFDFDGDTLWGKCILEKEQVLDAFDEKIAGFDRFLSIYGTTQNLLGTSVYEDAGYQYLIKDTRNFLHYYTPAEDAAPYAARVATLSHTLEAADIPLIYLQAPTKEIEGYTIFPPGIDYKNDENSDNMLKLLRENGVNVLSFREVFAEDGTDPGTLFYRTDHHWTTETAFRAFSAVLPYLNTQMDWSLDTALGDSKNWNSLFFAQSFLGSIGRRVGVELAGLDDYTYLEPAFATDYHVYYPPESTEIPYWSGSFHHTMVRDSLLYADDVSANRYASYFQYDYGELIIENLNCQNDLHIAIIKDSFALPFTAFLSTAVKNIDMIDLREFPGNVTQHLLETKPDLVLILYGNGSFSPKMYDFDQ